MEKISKFSFLRKTAGVESGQDCRDLDRSTKYNHDHDRDHDHDHDRT